MDEEFEPFETSYQTIFDHLKSEGKFISFELSHCMEDTLKENPYYNKYCVDKVNFRHLLEAKYKKDYEKNPSRVLRPFLDGINSKDCSYQKGFEKESEEIRKLINNFFLENYPYIEEEMVDYILTKTTIVKQLIDGLEAQDNFIKIEISGIKSLRNGACYLKAYFHLDEELKNTLINKVKIDSYSHCFGYENPAIYDANKKTIFACTTHEGYYQFL